MLAELMRLKYGVAIAARTKDDHGRRWLRLVMQKPDFDPTVIVGGKLIPWVAMRDSGTGNILVAEADRV